MIAAFLLALIACSAFFCAYESANENADSATPSGVSDDANPATDDHSDDIRPDAWGPYGVGLRSFDFRDESRDGRPVPTLVYYPAHATAITTESFADAVGDANILERINQSVFCAQPDAWPDASGGPYPVIAFSHGSGAKKEEYKYLYEYLASHGYVVIAPDHVGNVGLLQYWAWRIDMSVLRPFDVLFSLDQVSAFFAMPSDPFYGLGDGQRVGVAGHSYGGNTALGLAGAQFSYDYIASLCADHPADPYICPIVDARDLLESNLPDPRIKAALILAHDGSNSYFGPDSVGTSSMPAPVMLISGTADRLCPYEKEQKPCFATLPAPSYLLLLHGCGHLGFTDVIDEGPMHIERSHALIQRYAAAFFGYHLKGLEDYARFLSADFKSEWSGNTDDFDWSAKDQ